MSQLVLLNHVLCHFFDDFKVLLALTLEALCYRTKYTLLVQNFAGRKFREEKKCKILEINFCECPITTHFA